jgi:8-oxo-dGTP diphosphatase
VHDLPDDLIEHPAAGLTGYLDATSPLLEHAWQ